MSDCRFGVSPVNYPDPDLDVTKSVIFIRCHRPDMTKILLDRTDNAVSL